jgi:hypothetical protein
MKALIQIGALCEPISKQLAGRISKDNAALLDRHSDAITHCAIAGFLTRAQTDRARKKLCEMTEKAILSHAKNKA